MENASKALLIAGGILLAMMVLALLVYMLNAMGDMQESQNTRLLTKQIEEFNKSYLAYDKTRMYGTDVITVVNNAKENNIKYSDNPEYSMDVKIYDTTGNPISISYDEDFKISIFKCAEVKYNASTGRINEMIFEQLDL